MSNMEQFPGNSHKEKEQKNNLNAPEKVVEPLVLKGTIVQKKKSFGMKMKEVFIGGDSRSVGSYLLGEVLIPTLRDMLYDMMSMGSERMIYGDQRAPRRTTRNEPGRPKIRYDNMYEPRGRSSRGSLPGESRRDRPGSLQETIFQYKEDAMDVIDQLAEIIDKYEYAQVSDFKKIIGVPATYVDENWGWTNINYAEVRKVREGWIVNLPDVEPLGQ